MINGIYLHLLIIEDSENDAESLANILREAGYSIRLDHAREAEMIESALDAQIPDLVLCGNGAAVTSPETVQGMLAQRNLTTPVIAIVDETPEAVVIASIKSGISAVVSYDQPEHLQLVVDREIAVLQLQQRTSALDTAFADCEKRCLSLIEGSSDAIAYIHDGAHCFSNRAYMKLFGIDCQEDIEGTPILDMISTGQRDAFKTYLSNYQSGNHEDNMLSISCVNHLHVDFDSTMEFTPASIGGVPCTQVIIQTSIPRRRELEEIIETMTRQDSLTELHNRQSFMGLLEKHINYPDKSRNARALVYITLDRFKKIREENGIAASDIVLCDIAKLLEQHCCKEDILARFGDFSFTILYHASSSGEIEAAGNKLLDDISEHMSEVNGQVITMTCSIGICTIDEQSTDAQMILTHADTACEVARSSGGNQIHTHTAIIDEQIIEANEKEWDEVVRKTIDEERFYLAYQPIISLSGDTRKRYEALLRVVDEAGNTILPGEFLAIANKSGFSAEIDYWVLGTAIKKLSEIRKAGDEVTIFLKLSSTVLADANLPNWIHGKLNEYQIDSSSIVFQIQEIDAANDLKSTITFARAMKSLQCRVALEHFGSGKLPQLLKHVPVDILKIDGKLIEDLAGNKNHNTLVKDLVTLAHKHGKICIAERVDNPACLAILWQYGVDMMQGNFVQQPNRELAYNFEDEIA